MPPDGNGTCRNYTELKLHVSLYIGETEPNTHCFERKSQLFSDTVQPLTPTQPHAKQPQVKYQLKLYPTVPRPRSILILRQPQHAPKTT